MTSLCVRVAQRAFLGDDVVCGGAQAIGASLVRARRAHRRADGAGVVDLGLELAGAQTWGVGGWALLGLAAVAGWIFLKAVLRLSFFALVVSGLYLVYRNGWLPFLG